MSYVFEVSNASKTKKLRTIALLAYDAIEDIKDSFRKGSKLSATKVNDISVGQGKTVKAIHASRAIEMEYRRALNKLIAEMAGSVEYWTTAQYRKTPPRMTALVAEDSASDDMSRMFRKLARRWIDRFNEAAPLIAEKYIRGQFKHSDSAFMRALRDAGWTVDFKMTRAIKDALDASINENIALIRSIPEQYLKDVEGAVMRSYTAGRDLQTMVQDIKSAYPVADRRAVIIARDQSNKANAVVNRARSLEAGITQAKWMHSSAGKKPRLSHQHAHGKEFNIAEGMYIDGEWIQPGQLVNCRCTYRVILPI